MLNRLEKLARQGHLRALDYQFAKFVCQSAGRLDDALLALASALTSYELGQGHVCLMLDKVDVQRLFGLPTEHSQQLLGDVASPDSWVVQLADSPAVSDGSAPTPLVLTQNRLYLNRYWQFEQRVAGYLRHAAASAADHEVVDQARADSASQALAAPMAAQLNELFARDYRFLHQALSALDGEANTPQARQQEVCDKLDVVVPEMLDWAAIDQVLQSATDVAALARLDTLVPLAACLNWQKVAAAVALTQQFAVISGGPGTGKTTTVAKLLAALVAQALHRDERDEQGNLVMPDIKLVAPTGKAAARLTESIGAAVKSLPVGEDVKSHIPTQSSTIHRLLGAIPNRVGFRHNRDNPLHLDVLVVDEASMVDLPMMARLLESLPPHAKLILLGDRDQLASVEAGAVLGDICAFAGQGYSQTQSQQLSALTGFRFAAGNVQSVVNDSLCMLQKSYRFHAQSGIGQLAKAINSGQPSQVEKVWQQGFRDISFYPLSSESYQMLLNRTVTFYYDYLDAIAERQTPDVVLAQFAKVRLLCALREGDFGVTGLNQRIERMLEKNNKIKRGSEDVWYEGRPVMITQNDHGLGLYNGDIGITMLEAEPEAGSEPRLRVYFEMPDKTIRSVLPSRLPDHETVYAMTIHKSQGSEFADTLMVLPPDYSPILTRELIYTGVTRAKSRLALFATPEVVHRAVRLRTERASGLATLLSVPQR